MKALDPIETLAGYIRTAAGGDPPGLEQVLACFRPLKADRGQALLMPGQTCQHVYFIASGGVQAFHLEADGTESTREFYFEGSWVTDIFGFQNQLPSKEGIRALETCQLAAIDHTAFGILSRQVPPFAQQYRQILEASYERTVIRVNALLGLDALGRLKWVAANQPQLLQRVSSRMLASYLGISPETLTRLKAKL